MALSTKIQRALENCINSLGGICIGSQVFCSTPPSLCLQSGRQFSIAVAPREFNQDQVSHTNWCTTARRHATCTFHGKEIGFTFHPETSKTCDILNSCGRELYSQEHLQGRHPSLSLVYCVIHLPLFLKNVAVSKPLLWKERRSVKQPETYQLMVLDVKVIKYFKLSPGIQWGTSRGLTWNSTNGICLCLCNA